MTHYYKSFTTRFKDGSSGSILSSVSIDNRQNDPIRSQNTSDRKSTRNRE